MVLAALCEHYLPSHRGLARNHESLAVANDRNYWQKHEKSIKNKNKYNNRKNYNRNSILDLSQQNTSNDKSHALNQNKTGTKPRRNRCKASKFLASCAADFDVLTDWLFYAHCRSRNVESFENDGVYMIPTWMVGMVLATCVIGTTLWLVLATDGAVATPFLRKLGYDKLSLGHILLFCVLLEDLPQIVLTFFIEDYFEEDQEFNNYAVVNVVASLYDILIKIAEAYDQRADIVETGHWCKESIHAHAEKVICLVPIPEEKSNNHDGILAAAPQDFEETTSLFRNKLHVSPKAQDSARRRSLFREAQEMIAETKPPSMRFLSSSKDDEIKLWDTSDNDGEAERMPSQTFSGHDKRISCISLVRKVRAGEHFYPALQPHSTNDVELEPLGESHYKDASKDTLKSVYYFLTGSYDGTCKLWKTSDSNCLQTYTTIPAGGDSKSTLNLEVTRIAYIDSGADEGYIERPLTSYVSPSPSPSASSTAAINPTPTRSEYFVNGYKSGKVRLWDMHSGACLQIFEGRNTPSTRFFGAFRKKKSRIYSLCSMQDSRHFVAGSLDGSIKMWDIGMETTTSNQPIVPITPIAEMYETESVSESDYEIGRTLTITSTTSTVFTVTPTTTTPVQTFVGHSKAVFSVQCVSPGSVLLSGSEDRTAKLWSVSTGALLQIFSGHAGPIYDVAIVDQVTFLTASKDKTIRAWDAMSGEDFRTYENGSSAVTSVVTGAKSGCFLSGDENGRIGLWIFSAVHDEHQKASLLGIDDEEVMLCGGCEGDEELMEDEMADDYIRMT